MRIKARVTAIWLSAAVAAGGGVAQADVDEVDFYALSRELAAYGIVATPNNTAQVTLVDICDWLESEPGFFGTSNYGGPTDTEVVASIRERIANPTPAKVHALGALATSYFCPDQRGSLDGVLRSSDQPLLKAAASAGTWQKVANNGNINDWRLIIEEGSPGG